VAFTGALNEIILIAAIIAFVGAALGLALVRARDFVPVGGEGHTPSERPLPGTIAN
jgi:hypothetical protein